MFCPRPRPRTALLCLPLAALFTAVPVHAQHTPPPPPLKPAPAAVAAKVKLELVTRESLEPISVIGVPGETPARLFVVEKQGKIRILRGNKFDAQAFYDLTGRVSLWDRPNSEQGLLGLAFHPQHRKNGRAFINFTDKAGDTRVIEVRLDPKNPNRADPASEKTIFFVKQPYDNHNGGDLQFGPDGKLYVFLGDGGKANDPHGYGQNPTHLLAKALVIDVDRGDFKPTIIARGLRNPWRYSFDRKTGDLYIADVGQNLFEYVFVAPAGKLTGHNFGWNVVEGFHCFKPKTKNPADVVGLKCDVKGLTPPVMEYGHDQGCSISGGFVYRGKALPELAGHYFYGDFCTGLLRSFRYEKGRAVESWDWKPALDPEFQLSRLAGFGQDQDGELYLISHDGPIYKFVRK
jgi:glucose/arabinose dehydrogenase